MHSYIKNQNQKQDDPQIYILIAVLIAASIIIIATKGWNRLYLPGGILYEPQEVKSAQTAKKDENIAPAKPQEAKNGVTGIASWYDYEINGIEWSAGHRTCASRNLKRYSMARVTNKENGKSVECYVNDYIEHPERDIDLSSYAFSQIADLRQGLVEVLIEQL